MQPSRQLYQLNVQVIIFIKKGNQEDAIQTQVFRIWECDYGLEHGFAVSK